MDSSSPTTGTTTSDQEENADKFLRQLEKQLVTLKTDALDQGLQQGDLKNCVKAALSRSLGDKPKVKMSRWKKYALVTLAVALTLVTLPVATDLTLNSYPGLLLQDFLMKNYMTSAMMFLRRHTFFLHRFHISKIYADDCLINNPLYERPVPSCYVCRRVHAIQTVPEGYKVRRSHLGFPLIFKSRMESVVLLEELRDLLKEKRALLEGDKTSSLDVSVPWITSALDLADSDVITRIANTSDFKLVWAVNNLLVGQLLRKKFPRHRSLPPEMEVSLDKKLIVQGWDTPPLSLGDYSAGNGGRVLYIQGSGMRKLLLTPHPSCSSACIPVSVLVNQTDFVTWPSDSYVGTLYQAGSNVSVSMLGFLL